MIVKLFAQEQMSLNRLTNSDNKILSVFSQTLPILSDKKSIFKRSNLQANIC